jgi:hypothetical protein
VKHILAVDLVTQKCPTHEPPSPQPTLENRRGVRGFSTDAPHKSAQMVGNLLFRAFSPFVKDIVPLSL